MSKPKYRRISLPEGFLCADAILRLAQNVTDGLHVNEKIVERTVREYLPFMTSENLMMEAVKRGGDRQEFPIGIPPYCIINIKTLNLYREI